MVDCYEAIATLTAAAMDTQRVRLGSGIYCRTAASGPYDWEALEAFAAEIVGPG